MVNPVEQLADNLGRGGDMQALLMGDSPMSPESYLQWLHYHVSRVMDGPLPGQRALQMQIDTPLAEVLRLTAGYAV